MLRSHTHMPTSGLFIIRHTNRSYASSILEMLWLCSDHTPAKHLTIKAFLLQGHINSCLYRATQFDLTQYYISIQNYNVLVQIRLTSKTKRVSSISNLVYDLPHQLPNDVRLRILGNKEILGKSQIWVETKSSIKSPFQILNFGNSNQKTRKSRYQTFFFLPSFTAFPYFVPNRGWLIKRRGWYFTSNLQIGGANKWEEVGFTLNHLIRGGCQ